MSQLVRIVYTGREGEALVYTNIPEDLPKLLCYAGNAVNELVHSDEDEDEDAETTTGGYGAGYEANGQILAKLSALLQMAIANAPQLISEITTLIGLFGGKVPLAGPPRPRLTRPTARSSPSWPPAAGSDRQRPAVDRGGLHKTQLNQ